MNKLILAAGLLAASASLSADWPMWGGTPNRNMVSPLKGMPSQWDVKSGKNVKWMAALGSQSYGNPVVAAGRWRGGVLHLQPRPDCRRRPPGLPRQGKRWRGEGREAHGQARSRHH